MGYEVHITRKLDWADAEGPALSLDEWLDYLARDAQMRHDGYAEATNPEGETIRIESPGLAVWTAYSGHQEHGNMAWFMHFEDRVSVKNPDPEILRKMADIAGVLGATVQGDDGEAYDGKGMVTPVAVEPLSITPKRWWQFWR